MDASVNEAVLVGCGLAAASLWFFEIPSCAYCFKHSLFVTSAIKSKPLNKEAWVLSIPIANILVQELASF